VGWAIPDIEKLYPFVSKNIFPNLLGPDHMPPIPEFIQSRWSSLLDLANNTPTSGKCHEQIFRPAEIQTGL